MALLLVGCGFEAETANIEEYANDIGDGEERQGGEGCCGYRVEGEDSSRQRDTQVAWAKKAPRNLGGEVLISSKRESRPSSEVIREKRKVPTLKMLVQVLRFEDM